MTDQPLLEQEASFFRHAWRGELKLWKAFWLLYFLGSSVVFAIVVAAYFLFLALDQWSLLLEWALYAILLGFAIYGGVAVWGSARSSGVAVKFLARAYVLLNILGMCSFAVEWLFRR